jgi:thymidylate kinase
MWHVEFAGLPGSGKSTIMRHFIRLLEENDESCYTIGGALWESLRKNCEDKHCHRFLSILPKFYSRKKVQFIFDHSSDKWHAQSRFLSEYGGSFRAFFKSEQFEVMSPEVRSTVIRWFLRSAAVYQVINERINSEAVVVFDEGFVQRSMSLFVLPGHSNREFNRESLSCYIKSIPTPNLIVYVETELEECLSRIQSRSNGIPYRLKGIDNDGIRSFLTETQDHFSDLLRNDKKVIHIDNNHSVEVAAQNILYNYNMLKEIS